MLLRARADIEPPITEHPTKSGCRESILKRLLLDPAENAIYPNLDAVYPRFSKVSAPKYLQHTLPPATYPAPNSWDANSRDIRFCKIFLLTIYYGTWGSMLKRLLDESIHVRTREHYMDTALQCACYLGHEETLQMLLD